MAATTLRMHSLGSASSSASVEASSTCTSNQSRAGRVLSCATSGNNSAGDLRRGYSLANRIYSLSEPWRSRFVDLIAQRAGNAESSGPCPTQAQLALWLSDRQLARMIRMMLRTWTHEDISP